MPVRRPSGRVAAEAGRRSVALLEARDRVGGRTFTELRADGMDRQGRRLDRAGAGPHLRAHARVRGAELQAVRRRRGDDGPRRQAVALQGRRAALVEPVRDGESRHRDARARQDVQNHPVRGTVERQEGGQVGQHHRRAVAGPPCAVIAGPRSAGDGHRRHLHKRHLELAAVRAASNGVGRRAAVRVRHRGRCAGLPHRRRYGRGVRTDGRPDRRFPAPVPAGAAHRSERRRGDRQIR